MIAGVAAAAALAVGFGLGVWARDVSARDALLVMRRALRVVRSELVLEQQHESARVSEQTRAIVDDALAFTDGRGWDD